MNLISSLICLSSLLTTIIGSQEDRSNSKSHNKYDFDQKDFDQDQLDLAQTTVEFFNAYSAYFISDFDTGVWDEGAFFANDAIVCDVGTGCLFGLDAIRDNTAPFQDPVDLGFFNFKFLGINPTLILKPVSIQVSEFVRFPNQCQFILTRIYILYFNDDNLVTGFYAADRDSEAIKLFFTEGAKDPSECV